MVYMNTSVTRGTCVFVITATGMATEVGCISGMLQAQRAVRTALTRQLDRLSKQLLLVAGLALIASMAREPVPRLYLQQGDQRRGRLRHRRGPGAAAYGVTTILAWGTQALARARAIMKQLRSAETMGSTSAINTDKTGTLTLNQMTAVQWACGAHAQR